MGYAFYDRSYRLRNNRDQVRVDRISLASFAAASGAAVMTGGNVLGSGALGLIGGCLLGAIYNGTAGKDHK